jgi:muramoyltetrapeptide carboxypeptidase
MQKANALTPGATIGVVAPASSLKEEDLVQGSATLRELGFQVCYGDSVLAKHHYFAGPHEQRAAELTRMFEDPRIDAIFCARGGYGSHHIVSHLDPERVKANPKIFMGYSDVTVLLQFLENLCQMVCFHGPMVAREFALGEPFYVRENLISSLACKASGQKITSPRLETLRPGSARGPLTGGCLSLLTAMLGTPYEIQSRGKILFVEDVNTKPYQFDRMLMQLRLAGKLDGVQGMIFGEMLNCSSSDEQDYSLQEIILDTVGDLGFPILYGLPSGHTSTQNLTLPFGVNVFLNAGEKYLQLEEAAVNGPHVD